MVLIKKPDWRACLAKYLDAESRNQFEWGVSDCALFAAGAVGAMTGVDPADKWRGKYSDLRGGLALIRSAGFADHIAAAEAVLSSTDRPHVGDIAVVDGDGTAEALGVVQGSWIAVRSVGAIAFIPIGRAKRVLSCG